VKTRQRPNSDVEKCFRSSAACLLGNIAYRSHSLVDWDDRNKTVLQKDVEKYLHRDYRSPWKLQV
jgi:hypothetical protein